MEIAEHTIAPEISLDNPIITHVSSKLIDTLNEIMILLYGDVSLSQWFMKQSSYS